MINYKNILNKLYLEPVSTSPVIKFVCNADDKDFDFEKFEKELKEKDDSNI
jgi:hypothetical protein